MFSCGGGYQGEIDNVRIKYEENFNGHNFKNIFVNHDMYYDGLLTSFKTKGGKMGKNYYCEFGAKLISQRQIVVSQKHQLGSMSTIDQLKAFGKLNDKYQGVGQHDDISITVLFASRFFDDNDFLEWIEEWLDTLSMTNYGDTEFRYKLRKSFELRQKFQEQQDDEISDQDFKDQILSAASGFGQIHDNINAQTYGNIIKQAMERQKYKKYGRYY